MFANWSRVSSVNHFRYGCDYAGVSTNQIQARGYLDPLTLKLTNEAADCPEREMSIAATNASGAWSRSSQLRAAKKTKRRKLLRSTWAASSVPVFWQDLTTFLRHQKQGYQVKNRWITMPLPFLMSYRFHNAFLYQISSIPWCMICW